MKLRAHTASHQDRANERYARWLTPVAFLLATLYLYVSLYSLSGIPFLLEGDQQFFWIYGQRPGAQCSNSN